MTYLTDLREQQEKNQERERSSWADTLKQRLQVLAVLFVHSQGHYVHGLIVAFCQASLWVLDLQVERNNLDNVLQIRFNYLDNLKKMMRKWYPRPWSCAQQARLL